MLLAIDPGTTKSAWVLYDESNAQIDQFGHVENHELLERLAELSVPRPALVIEMVASYGMPVGREVFETVYWIGRYAQAWRFLCGVEAERLYRGEVKSHLCGSPRARDANVRQALLDRWGGKSQAVGTKSAPGPCYGVSGDVWAALAVAVTWAETADRRGAAPSLPRGA